MLDRIRDASVPTRQAHKRVDDTLQALISAAERGDLVARDSLFAALYAELHRLARRELARRGSIAGIGVTTLLHDAYLAMASRSEPVFPDRARFMGYAARVMRGVIVDHARERHAIKRGGAFEITSLPADVAGHAVDYDELSAISAAIDDLERLDPSLAQVVDLRFFCGFSILEIAAMQAISERTVHRKWEKARIYLRQYLRPDALEES
jgi:RNA polymerase sigma factor (TIGR02999 family)